MHLQWACMNSRRHEYRGISIWIISKTEQSIKSKPTPWTRPGNDSHPTPATTPGSCATLKAMRCRSTTRCEGTSTRRGRFKSTRTGCSATHLMTWETWLTSRIKCRYCSPIQYNKTKGKHRICPNSNPRNNFNRATRIFPWAPRRRPFSLSKTKLKGLLT